MSDIERKKLLSPVLDRLLGESNSIDYNQSHQVIRQLRESVRRDLESLFNSRYSFLSPSSTQPHLKFSIVDYGLPDLSSVNLSSQDTRKAFFKEMEKVILSYEPRIKSVSVKSEHEIDIEDPSIRFRVEATLHFNPASEIIIFDSSINPVTQTVEISEAS